MAAFDSPFLVFGIGFIVQVVAAYLGDRLRRRVQAVWKEERPEYDILRTAALTLLGLLIGFSFAMAVSRYDQRKNLEEAEANAIGTEYLRADLLPAQDAARVRELLRKYTNLRIQNYQINDERLLGDIDAATARVQVDMWSAIVNVSKTEPTPPVTLALWGMNEVINSQGYTQAAWWNRIPLTAWILMGMIAITCNLLLAYGEHRTIWFLLVLPLIVSISFFLIADIDSPRTGLIRNLPTKPCRSAAIDETAMTLQVRRRPLSR